MEKIKLSKKQKISELQTNYLQSLGFNAQVRYNDREKFWSVYICKNGIWLSFSYSSLATGEQIVSMLKTSLNGLLL